MQWRHAQRDRRRSHQHCDRHRQRRAGWNSIAGPITVSGGTLTGTGSGALLNVTGEGRKSPVELTWERCLPTGCVAGVVVTDGIVPRLSSVSEPGSIVFKDAADRDVALPLSFRGLSQAAAALGEETQF